MLDIVHGSRDATRLEIFNLVNPHTAKWESLVPTLQSRTPDNTPLLPISFADWTKLLHRVDINNEQELAAMPAAKIIDFYEGMQQDDDKHGGRLLCETANGRSVSKTMESLQPIGKE